MGKLILKRKLALSASLMLLSLMNAVPTMADDNPTGFADMRDHWAKKAVATAIAKKYVDGYSDGSFRPENYVTGAEFIKMIVTASELKVSGSTEGSQWFVPYIKAAVEKGLVREEAITASFLENPITRLEMSKVAVRSTDPSLQQKHVSLNDQGVMYTAVNKGLIQGLSGGELAPEGKTTRAQSVTIVERVLTLNNGEKLPVDKVAIGQAELQLKRTNMFSMIPMFTAQQNEGLTWLPEKLTYATPDGKYKGEIDQVVAIDMEDANDPNRHLLGDINELHWFDQTERSGKEMPLVKDYPKSYVILVKSHTVFNNDTESYPGRYGLGMSFTGFKIPDEKAFHNGTLNTLTSVFKNRFGDMGAFILPKDGAEAPRGIDIQIFVPAKPPVKDMTHTITSLQTYQP
ncbi:MULTISPECIES: S-layer homology domain-containing protein [unclassified Paenibacillus]|uniref:S-layer homology domain-containing protein n=1 Tax=unclassified Paenibacillus TaxID=185978 RepID=UPI0027847E5D|nr:MULTISPECIES: S-layer homology domain-containing protein [unclassified Paenibacillus]MDQ0896200.1 hypothetical protein [Paenibacillus sp. V4I7]MDQ0913984.1 hypothetical protein [Paenibacillus sp. V4I5]